MVQGQRKEGKVVSVMLTDTVYAAKRKGGKWHLSYLPSAAPLRRALCGNRPQVDEEEAIRSRKDLDALMKRTQGRMCVGCARSAP